jgi:broad specificity phosphatase PhoE
MVLTWGFVHSGPGPRLLCSTVVAPALPGRSGHGLDREAAAQQRVVTAVERCLTQATTGDVAVVAHAAVGTLLWCHLADEPIDRRHDQPGQGSWYSVDLPTMRPPSSWTRLQLFP